MPNPAAARRDAEEALRPVSDDEAQEILSRFIASHFRKHDREHARFRIPADPEHDDDLRMSQYIRETRALRALLAQQESPAPDAAVREAAERLREVASAGVEFDDERLDYVTVQIDRETWNAVRALAARGGE